jgi:hypothetical protein
LVGTGWSADPADLADGTYRIPGRSLDLGDLAGDILGRLRGLCRQALDLGRDHGEPIAFPCGFDRRVQRQRVGLRGNSLKLAWEANFLNHHKVFARALTAMDDGLV